MFSSHLQEQSFILKELYIHENATLVYPW